MPHTTIIKEEFARVVKDFMRGLSAGQVSLKTGISYEYIRRMAYGHVPSEDVLKRFANGMNVDLQTLRIAAGYEQPTDAVEAVALGLRGATNIPEDGKSQIIEFAKMIEEKYAGKHKHSFEGE